MKYTTPDKLPRLGIKSDEDTGIDLPNRWWMRTVILPWEYQVIDTGIIFDFKIFGRVRRAIWKLILGIDVFGIGGLIKPRGRHNTLIMAGLVDPGYRGTIKIKIFNPNPEPAVFEPGEPVGQLVPILSINEQPQFTIFSLEPKTKRGDSGGINCSQQQTQEEIS